MTSQPSLLPLGHPAVWMRALSLVGQAVRARWVPAAVLALAFAAAGLGAALALPPTFESRTRLLAQRNTVMPALAHPTRTVPFNADAPTQAASEFILNRQALESIVLGADLLSRWDRERPWALRLKDRAIETVFGPMSEEDRADALVEVLGRRLTVSVNNDVITLNATWWSAGTALDIVNAAKEAFLEARRKVDVQAIDDTGAVLARSVEEHRARLEAQMALVTARVSRPPARARLATAAPPVVTTAASRPDLRLNDLRERITVAQQATADAERRHRESVRAAEAALAAARVGRTAQHPDVVSAQRALARLGEEPDALRAARAAESVAVDEFMRAGGRLEAAPAATASAPVAAVSDPVATPPAPAAVAGVEDGYSRALLDNLIAVYQDLLTRQANAQVELETAKAAFRYRYSVIYPARLAKKATGPNRPLILTGALMAGLMAGLLQAVFAELRARSLLSPAALLDHLGARRPEMLA